MFKADLTKRLRRRRTDNGIAELIEIAEVDSPTMREQLFVKRHGVRFRSHEIQWQIVGATAREQHFQLVERRSIRWFVLGARGGSIRQCEPQPRQDFATR